LATAVTGTGSFKINGTEIQYDAASDSLATVLARINDSTAGVTAVYETANDRVVLYNRATGNRGVALEDVQGNFLQATGLLDAAGGSLVAGQDLQYQLNGGATRTSESNTISESSSGVPGLSVTALTTGSVTVTVSQDVEAIKTAISDFVDSYNKVQSVIGNYTASSTDADGKVTAGVLANDLETHEISRTLRGLSMGTASDPDLGAVVRLEQLGYEGNGYDNQLALSDSDTLDQALSTQLADVKKFFTNATAGLAVTLDAFLENTTGVDGTLEDQEDSLTVQSSRIDDQITEMERIVQMHRENLINSFVAMETARSNLNQQLQYLMQQCGTS